MVARSMMRASATVEASRTRSFLRRPVAENLTKGMET